MAQHFHGQYGPGRRDLPMGGPTGSPAPRVRATSSNGARGFPRTPQMVPNNTISPNPTSPPAAPVNPMMMMMNMMRKNPNANPEWIEFMLPRMMTQMQSMMQEFRNQKMNKQMNPTPGFSKTPNLSGAEMNEIKLALDSLQKKQSAIAAQEAAQANPDKRNARVKLVKQMRMQLQNKYLNFYYIREIRGNLMSLQMQLNALEVYPEDETDLSFFLSQGKELLGKVENPHGGEASLTVVKNVFQALKTLILSASATQQLKFEEAKETLEEKPESASVSECKLLKIHQLLKRDFSSLTDTVRYMEHAFVRIDGFPDKKAVSSWFKCWRDLWKLQAIANPTPAAFSGEGGELLKEMLPHFRSEHSQLLYKIDQVGIGSFIVDQEVLQDDSDLLKIALHPIKKKPVISSENELRQWLDAFNEMEKADVCEDESKLEMHPKLLRDAVTSTQCLKRIRTWLGEKFAKPLSRSPLPGRLEEILANLDDAESISESHTLLIKSLLKELEDRRGWIADRFDSLEDQRLLECAIQLAIVMISSKHDGIVVLLGGKDGQVAQTLANVKKIESAKKGPVKADVVTITAILTSIREEESPKKNEDEIDLDDSEEEDEEPEQEKPLNPANMKQHLQNLLNKLDGKPKEDAPPAAEEDPVEEEPISDPEMEEISSDETEDEETPIDFGAALKPPSPPPQVEINEENVKLLKNARPIPTIPVHNPRHFHISQKHRRGRLAHFSEPPEIGNCYEKLATKRAAKADLEMEAELMKKSAANMNNIILILTSGGDTPTYDERNGSRASTPANPDSAEEGECNDDGVELKPSLRIKNLIDSPEREEKEAKKLQESASEQLEKAKIRLERVESSPPRIKSIDKDDPEMSEISSDESAEEEPVKQEPLPEAVSELAEAVTDPPESMISEEPSTIEVIKKENRRKSTEQEKTPEKPKIVAKYSSDDEIPSDSEPQPDDKKATAKTSERIKLEPIVLQNRNKSRANGAHHKHEPTVRFRPTFSPEREEMIEKPELDIIKKDNLSQDSQESKSDFDRTRSITSDADSIDRLESISQRSSETSSKHNYVLTDISPPQPPSKRRSKELAPPPPPSSSSRRKERRSSSNSSNSRHNLPLPPQPASRRKEHKVTIAKGQSLKEALEYTPAARKSAPVKQSAEERVKALKARLEEMERVMRTGVIDSSSLKKGPQSALDEEYYPTGAKAKKQKKSRYQQVAEPPPPPPAKKKAPPPPPPPKRQFGAEPPPPPKKTDSPRSRSPPPAPPKSGRDNSTRPPPPPPPKNTKKPPRTPESDEFSLNDSLTIVSNSPRSPRSPSSPSPQRPTENRGPSTPPAPPRRSRSTSSPSPSKTRSRRARSPKTPSPERPAPPSPPRRLSDGVAGPQAPPRKLSDGLAGPLPPPSTDSPAKRKREKSGSGNEPSSKIHVLQDEDPFDSFGAGPMPPRPPTSRSAPSPDTFGPALPAGMTPFDDPNSEEDEWVVKPPSSSKKSKKEKKEKKRKKDKKRKSSRSER